MNHCNFSVRGNMYITTDIYLVDLVLYTHKYRVEQDGETSCGALHLPPPMILHDDYDRSIKSATSKKEICT